MAPALAKVNGATKAPRAVEPRTVPSPPSVPDALREIALVGFEAIDAVAAEHVDYLLDGVIARDHMTEIAGPSGSGKTTLAMLVAMGAAHVGPEPASVLGRRVTPIAPGKFVVILEEENSRRSCRDKLLASCQMLGIDPRATLDRVILLARAGIRAADNPQWKAIFELARGGRVGLVVIDSRARVFAGVDSKDEDDQAEVAAVVASLIKAAGAPVVVISHTRKGTPSGLDDVSGSHQRVAAADVVLLVSAKKSDGRVLSSRIVFEKLRDAVDEHPLPVTLAISKDKAGTWRCAVTGGSTEDEGNAPAAERVHALLAERGELTKNAIREALHMSGDTVEDAITALFEDKRIKKRARAGRDVFSARAEKGSFDELWNAPKKPKAARNDDD